MAHQRRSGAIMAHQRRTGAIMAHQRRSGRITVCRWRAPPHEAWWFGRCRCRVARLADVRLDRGERCGAHLMRLAIGRSRTQSDAIRRNQTTRDSARDSAHLSNGRAAPDSLLKLVAREACPCERIEERRLPRRGLAHESDAIGPADEGGNQRRNQRRPS